jgi:hypothetical protein
MAGRGTGKSTLSELDNLRMLTARPRATGDTLVAAHMTGVREPCEIGAHRRVQQPACQWLALGPGGGADMKALTR